MADTKKNIPQIRFKGFEEEWEDNKLGNIASKVTEKNSSLRFEETFTNSAEFGVVSQKDFFDHDITNQKNIGGYYVVKNDDFVYNPRISTFAPVGPINRNKLKRSGVMSPLYTIFRPHDIDLTFLEWFFKSNSWHSFMNFNGDSGARADRFSIKDTVFWTMPILSPKDTTEQSSIANFFRTLDTLISNRQKKLESLRNLKKSCLTKMFPQNGSKVPEIRFKGFEGEWEEKELKEMLKTHSFRNFISEPQQMGKYEIIQQGDNPICGYSNNKPYENYKDVVLFGDHTLSVYKPQKPFLIATDGIKIISSNEISGDFLALLIKRYLPQNEGYKRYFSILKECIVTFPKEGQECEELVLFFTKLDKLISIKEKEIEKLQNLKKACLNKMFV